MRRLLPLAAVVLALVGCGGGEVTGPFPTKVIGTVAQAPSGATAGKMLFLSNGCGACHTFTPAGAAVSLYVELVSSPPVLSKVNVPVELLER